MDGKNNRQYWLGLVIKRKWQRRRSEKKKGSQVLSLAVVDGEVLVTEVASPTGRPGLC